MQAVRGSERRRARSSSSHAAHSHRGSSTAIDAREPRGLRPVSQQLRHRDEVREMSCVLARHKENFGGGCALRPGARCACSLDAPCDRKSETATTRLLDEREQLRARRAQACARGARLVARPPSGRQSAFEASAKSRARGGVGGVLAAAEGGGLHPFEANASCFPKALSGQCRTVTYNDDTF